MECNRDEALRATQIAEKKFQAKDFSGAKRFAVKAQNLYPGLEGISQMLATLDVYISAGNKINGEADWYGILGVDSLANEETVRKRYRKLALMLHPDKNKSVGADGAFKLISEAWSLLSDNSKRLAYDQKRGPKVFQQKVRPPSQAAPMPPGRYAFSSFCNQIPKSNSAKSNSSYVPTPQSNTATGNSFSVATAKSNTTKVNLSSVPPPKRNTTGVNVSSVSSRKSNTAKVHGCVPTPKSNTSKVNSCAVPAPNGNATKVNSHSAPTSSHKLKPTTFWTVCHRCKLQYEYLRMFLNCNLLCPKCNEPYYAREIVPPISSGSKVPSYWSHYRQPKNVNHQGASKNIPKPGRNNSVASNLKAGGFNGLDSSDIANVQWEPFSGTTGAASAAQAASMVQKAYEKVKRKREQAQATQKREEALLRKNQTLKETGGISSSGNSNAAKRRKCMEDLGATNSRRSITDQTGKWTEGATNKSNGIRDASVIPIQHLLMEKARKDILVKLNEHNTPIPKHDAKGKKNASEKAKEKEEDYAVTNSGNQVENMITNPIGTGIGVSPGQFIPGTTVGNSGENADEWMSVNVPDSDFHDFDGDRTEKCFDSNQVWAAYDNNDDGMPRHYAMIHDVISLDPFKMQISWLNSKTSAEQGPLNLVVSGLSKTCGDFRIGEPEISNSLNSFSHKVRWSTCSLGAIQISPKKGDVWAIYRDWSPEWNEPTAVADKLKYDLVEVLEDYDDELGVSVIPLIKVTGFMSVFHRHLDPGKERRIPKEEMLRFSHHIPSYLLSGEESPSAPKGCRELDPAATPPELLEVITDVEEVVVETEGKSLVEKILDGTGEKG